MVGFVMVVDSDFAAVTGPDGAFRFDNVPPGTYVAEGLERGERRSVAARGRARAGPTPRSRSRLDVTGFQPEPHKNKYGKDYPPNAGAETMSATEAPSTLGVTSSETPAHAA